MLAEQWEESEEEVRDLLTYTKDLRDNLNHLWEEAHKTLREAQTKQKAYYDTHGAPRNLREGRVRPQVEKIQAIKQLPLPSTKKDVRAFLGMAAPSRRENTSSTSSDPEEHIAATNPDSIPGVKGRVQAASGYGGYKREDLELDGGDGEDDRSKEPRSVTREEQDVLATEK
ncbi:hypothetical protein NDU88_005724 [Pleurodeles waltl]|uniref:Uncharacterized protein n=1 Tax=Pleurodeles waltl TaxID=8319 RepID=A0AAV7MBC5_PLEWA|nr:hypothetical protein NDU88_005724 [Pleurodeles waltl]